MKNFYPILLMSLLTFVFLYGCKNNPVSSNSTNNNNVSFSISHIFVSSADTIHFFAKPNVDIRLDSLEIWFAWGGTWSGTYTWEMSKDSSYYIAWSTYYQGIYKFDLSGIIKSSGNKFAVTAKDSI